MTQSASTDAPRVIGPWAGTAIVAGSMLGVGIVLVPRVVADQVPSPALFLLLWLAGGVVAVAGAVAYAELGAMLPQAGGDYVYLREAYGPSTSFAGGWLLFAGVFTGSLATMAVATCQYQLPVLLAPLVDVDLAAMLWDVPGPGALTGTTLAALILVWTITLVNLSGARPAAHTQLLVTALPIAALTVFALGALITAPHGSALAVLPEAVGPVTIEGLATAYLAIYFAYAGWNGVAYVAGEVTNPGRNVPRALLTGTGLITALYLVLCGAFLAILGLGGLRTAFEAGTASAVALLGDSAQLAVCAVLTVALVGSINSTVLGGARIGFAMGRDGALPRALAKLSPHTAVPARALVLQAALASVLILTGTFERLVSLTSMAMLLLGSLTVVALALLRRQRPQAVRPYRAAFYPWLPGVYLLISLAVLGVSALRAVRGSGEEGPTTDDLYPVIGVAVFGVLLAGHAIWARLRRS